jgi:hypothetical protein
MANWEVFKHQGGRSATVMRVSLNTRGVLTLNQVAFDALLTPVAVELLFDGDENLIGLRPTGKDVRHSYPVRKQGTNKSYLIGAKAFVNYYRIELEQTIAFNDVKIADGIMVLNLNNFTALPGRTSKSNPAPEIRLGTPREVARAAQAPAPSGDDDIPF